MATIKKDSPLKRTAWGHTKIKRLMRALNVPQYVAVGILESLWNLTARETPTGNIGKLSNEDIALQIDWRDNPDDLVQGLLASGWIDVDEELRLIVHDWHEHADDATDNALARAGQHYANGCKPRMKRLEGKEKATLNARFYAQKPTKAHAVRTENHEKPLPCQSLARALPEPRPLESAPPAGDEPPEGLAMLQYANWLLEKRNIPAVQATLLSCSAAIGVYARKFAKPNHQAVVGLESLAADAQARGQPVNKFWFEDPDKWQQKQEKTNGHNSNHSVSEELESLIRSARGGCEVV